jgi:hypothetical protein
VCDGGQEGACWSRAFPHLVLSHLVASSWSGHVSGTSRIVVLWVRGRASWNHHRDGVPKLQVHLLCTNVSKNAELQHAYLHEKGNNYIGAVPLESLGQYLVPPVVQVIFFFFFSSTGVWPRGFASTAHVSYTPQPFLHLVNFSNWVFLP